ncbi:MAG: hypothetical protein Q9207_000331 [Kuettlingeria erythrocarpa]
MAQRVFEAAHREAMPSTRQDQRSAADKDGGHAGSSSSKRTEKYLAISSVRCRSPETWLEKQNGQSLFPKTPNKQPNPPGGVSPSTPRGRSQPANSQCSGFDVPDWDDDTVGIESLKAFGRNDPSSKSATGTTVTADESPASQESSGIESILNQISNNVGEEDDNLDKVTSSQSPAAPSEESDEGSDTSPDLGNGSTPAGKGAEEPKNLQDNIKFNDESAAVEETPAEPAVEPLSDVHGGGRFEVMGVPDNGMPKIHWSRLPEHFPIPTNNIIPLPTGKPKAIPTIQYSKFRDESSDARVQREAKLDEIKKTFAFSWEGYRKNAWMQDELSPVTGNYKNPFCGWAATLVDSLDSLWMLGMKEEFEEAAEAVGKIDFTTSIRNDLPLFEVTIRYLGGLVAAFDISGGKYRVLLDKAVELAEVLMGAFDTPNRMPMTFYLWKPTFASQPHRARTRVVLAELGSLSLEFTRLAQITKEAKYYDAIARITDEFERWQNNTKMPGLWPRQVDASGCKKLDSSYIPTVNPSVQKRPGFYNDQSPQIPKSRKTTGSDEMLNSASDNATEKRALEVDIATEVSGSRFEKRQMTGAEWSIGSAEPKPDCMAQGLASPPGSGWEEFTIGGSADSTYEYLLKEYVLLGGLEEKYRNMYEMAAEATKKNLMFRPMIEDEERNILVAGIVATSGKPSTSTSTSTRTRKLKPEQAHLTCFAGGMFAMGAKLFNRKADMDVAKRLTDGCVWAYEMTPTGIMPEQFLITPCEDDKKCPFNRTLWYEKLDPYHPRSQTRSESKQVVLDDMKKESSVQAAAKTAMPGPPDNDPSATLTKTNSSEAPTSALGKRQLGNIENDKSVQSQKEEDEDGEFTSRPEVTDTISHQKSEVELKVSDDKHQTREGAKDEAAEAKEAATPTSAEEVAEPVAPVVAAYTPPPIPSQKEYAETRIRDEKLPKGVTRITGSKYILRPEAVESVFIMYRVTGDEYWRQKGWKMFTAIQNHTRTEYGASAISDVMRETPYPLDEMESFWLAETLKYFYLLFSEPDYYSLDDYVLYDCSLPIACSLFPLPCR